MIYKIKSLVFHIKAKMTVFFRKKQVLGRPNRPNRNAEPTELGLRIEPLELNRHIKRNRRNRNRWNR